MNSEYKGPKQLAIEAEFGEPLFDVVKGFASMGYGKDTVAKILDYDISSFRRLMKKRGWYDSIAWPEYKDQVIHKDKGPLSKETKQKIREKALIRERKIREEKLATGWRPVRKREYHNF